MGERSQRPMPVRSIAASAGARAIVGALELRPLCLSLGVLALLQGCAQIPESTAIPGSVQVSPVYRVGTPQGTAAGQYAVGRIDLAAGRIDAAITRFRNAIAIDPDFVDAYNGLGVAHGLARRLPEAIAAFREGLGRAPDAPHLLNNLGYALLEAGEPQQAAAPLERSLAADPSNRQTIENLRLLGEAGTRTPVPAENPVAAALQTPAMSSSPSSIAAVAPAATVPVDQTVRQGTSAAGANGPVRGDEGPARLVALGPNLFEYRVSSGPGGQPLPAVESGGARASPVSSERPQGRAAPSSPPVGVKEAWGGPALPSEPSAVRVTQTDPVGAGTAPSPGRADRTVRPAGASQPALPEGPAIDRSARREPDRVLVSARASSILPLSAGDLAPSGVEVSNGVGIPHLAGRTARRLSRLGVAVVRVTDHWNFGVQRTQILYREGHLERAVALRSALPVEARLVPTARLAEGVNVRVVLGRDLTAARVAFLEGDEPTVAQSPAEPSIPPQSVSGPLAALMRGLGDLSVSDRSGWRHS